MLHGPLAGKVLKFALPLAMTGILQQLFNAADVAIIGRYVGKNAMAAVGANTSIVSLIVTLFIGISIGANVVIAMAIGHGSKERVKKAIHTALVFALIGGMVIFGVGELFAHPFMVMMGVPDEVLPMAVLYLRVYLAGMPVILFYNFEAAILRADGDTRTPLIALTFAGVMNVLLNLFFVIKCHMAAEGVALATVLANIASALILLRTLQKNKGNVSVRLSELRIDLDVLKSELRIGVPAGIQSGVKAIANVVIQSAINSLGATVMAGSSAAFNVEVIAFLILDAFGQTCTTFIGQNYGAHQYGRCKKILFTCLIEDVIATGAAIITLLFFGRHLLALFNTNPEVIDAGMVRMTYLMAGFPFSMVNEIFSGYLRGFGRSVPPAVTSLMGTCAIRIIWVFFVFPHQRTFSWLMTCYPISLATAMTMTMMLVIIMRPSAKMKKISP